MSLLAINGKITNVIPLYPSDMKISYKPIIGEYAYFDPRISLEKHDFFIFLTATIDYSWDIPF